MEELNKPAKQTTEKKQKLTKEQQVLVEENVEYASSIAKKLFSKFVKINPSYELDVFISAATTGLIDAVKTYNPKKGVNLKTYSFQRIQGAVIDELKKNDHLSSTHRKNLKEGEQEIKYRYIPTPDSIDESHKNTIYDNKLTPEDQLLEKEIKAKLLEVMKSLENDKERYIIESIYFQGKTQEFLAAELGVNKSWISRLKDKALKTMRIRLKQLGIKDPFKTGK